jgi:hypothetical protein
MDNPNLVFSLERSPIREIASKRQQNLYRLFLANSSIQRLFNQFYDGGSVKFQNNQIPTFTNYVMPLVSGHGSIYQN